MDNETAQILGGGVRVGKEVWVGEWKVWERVGEWESQVGEWEVWMRVGFACG